MTSLPKSMNALRSRHLQLVSHKGGKQSTKTDIRLSPELSEEDRALALAVYRGDVRASDPLHDRLIGPIEHAVVRILGERTNEHEDIVQNCFEQVILSLARGKFEGNCSLSTWAGRIASHVALNAIRKRVQERSYFEQSEMMTESHPSHDGHRRAESRLQLRRVRAVLARMSPRTSEVLILHDMHGYQLDEIASMLKITVAAAQSRLVRGRKEFLRRLGPQPTADADEVTS